MDEKRKQNQVRRFQFLASWLAHENFFPFISSSWTTGCEFPDSLQKFKGELMTWNKEVYGNIFKRKKQLLHELNSLEMLNGKRPTTSTLEKEQSTREELEKTLWQEERLWIQKSRTNWVVRGDMNTRYFHNSTISRRKRNMISYLKDDQGKWIDDETELHKLAREYFLNLFTSNLARDIHGVPADFPEICDELLRRLGDKPNKETGKAVIMDMSGLKAPGKDGFQAIFFHKCWSSIGNDFFLFILSCFLNPSRIQDMNETLLALIPKIERPSNMSQFRPISMCNVSYKVVAKILANKLKPLMPILVQKNQSSFIPNRDITDNIIILQETVHSMARRSGKKGLMLLKIDLAKAYDRLEWDFLEDTLKDVRLPNSFISMIMKCVSSTSFQVLWNGSETESFKPSHGLRQGCPLSPYLFTLCMERLSHCIQKEVMKGNWKPCRLSPGGPALSHLFFADDLVLFAEASPHHADIILDSLNRFCIASGEMVSKEKSRVFFSKNVKNQNRKEICSRLGIQSTTDLGRYLGVPVLHGRLTISTY
ncbi:unnamed protein product [Linum trigynum]|uniref:Reverse transcriptase domain-containing protein n=1 Tax=Linum trigynum TaxID=586398 RepID=A0AAV2ECB8_9ROSI